ncbi:unnamed protein product [Cyprideis torosa]|uniref:Uncharacterized protein n=1 Tax=Cyprideis torosa TaxID=163714 RepID=A0A7R8WM12_9CRUS|nr:unnamed protein product [Cyprideis torosa]CAG0898743.1 unnamed protein product [Cyprideis torosa]
MTEFAEEKTIIYRCKCNLTMIDDSVLQFEATCRYGEWIFEQNSLCNESAAVIFEDGNGTQMCYYFETDQRLNYPEAVKYCHNKYQGAGGMITFVPEEDVVLQNMQIKMINLSLDGVFTGHSISHVLGASKCTSPTSECVGLWLQASGIDVLLEALTIPATQLDFLNANETVLALTNNATKVAEDRQWTDRLVPVCQVNTTGPFQTVPSSRYIRSPDDSCFYLDEEEKDLKAAAEFCHEELNGTLAEFDEFDMALLIERLNSLNVTGAGTWFHTRSEKAYWDEPVGLEPKIAIKYWKYKNGSILPSAMFSEGFPTKREASHHCSILTPTGLRDEECEATVPTLCSMNLYSVELTCSAPMDNTSLGFLTTSAVSNYVWDDVVNYECYCNGVWSQTGIKTTPSTCLGGSGWTNDGIRLDYCQHVPPEEGELATNEGKACYLVVNNPPPTHPILKEKTGIFRAAGYCQDLGLVLAQPFNEDFFSIRKAMWRLYVRLLPSIDNTTFDKIAYIGLNKRNPYGRTTNQYRRRDNQTMSDAELVDVWSNLISASPEDCVGLTFDSGTPNPAECESRNHTFAVCQLSEGAAETFSLDCIDPPWHSEMDPRMIEVSSPTPRAPGSVASFLCPVGEAMPIQQSNQIQLECIGENVGWLLKSGFPNETCSPVCEPPSTVGLVNTQYNISDSVIYYVPNDTIAYTCTAGNWFNVSGGGPPAQISTCTENSTWDNLPVLDCVSSSTFCLDPQPSLTTMYLSVMPKPSPHAEGTWARYECKCNMVTEADPSKNGTDTQCINGKWFEEQGPRCIKANGTLPGAYVENDHDQGCLYVLPLPPKSTLIDAATACHQEGMSISVALSQSQELEVLRTTEMRLRTPAYTVAIGINKVYSNHDPYFTTVNGSLVSFDDISPFPADYLERMDCIFITRNYSNLKFFSDEQALVQNLTALQETHSRVQQSCFRGNGPQAVVCDMNSQRGCERSPPVLENATFFNTNESFFGASVTYLCGDKYINPLNGKNTTEAICFGPAGWFFPESPDFKGCTPVCVPQDLGAQHRYVDEDVPDVLLPGDSLIVRLAIPIATKCHAAQEESNDMICWFHVISRSFECI